MTASLPSIRQRLARIFFLCMVGGLPSLLLADPTPRQQELLHLLQHDCGSCHGGRLLGGLGPPLVPTALAGKSKAYLEYIILNGIPGSPMPPWQPILSREEVQWLVDRLLEGVPE